ncbi:MAG: tetratricopeptide repeat protein [Promethearchaeota archaeon]
MKPLGTITMYFPHVDENTRKAIEQIMSEAGNYADFAERLCDRVISEPSSPLLEYLAFLFAYRIENFNLTDKLEIAGKVTDLSRPLLLMVELERGARISWSEMKTSIKSALEVAPNDWVASHLYLQWRISTENYFPEADVEVEPLDMISTAVNENSEMRYFELWLLRIAAVKFEKEAQMNQRISHLRQALAIARKFDDRVAAVSILVQLAGNTKHTDLKKAIDMLVTGKELGEELGYTSVIGLIQHQMAHIMGMRGEYDAAIKYQYEYKAIIESLGNTTFILSAVIAMHYNLSGNGEKALKLSKEAFIPERTQHRYLPYARAQQAWALINLGRYAEAKEVIDICHELALKSGRSGQMTWYYMVEGLLDKAEKRFDNAIMNFQEALDKDVEDPVPLTKNICLLNLTEMEIDMLTDTALQEGHDLSGQWMKKFEEHVQEHDLPGIAAQSMILRAKLRYRQGKYDDVRRILKDVQEIAKTPSMRYLNDMIISKFPDVIVT